jgi:hypothetical protein
VLKGPALAALLYRAEEQRAYSDVDLLVDPARLDAARAALTALGYENASERAGVDDFLGVLHADMWVRTAGVSIDLHWRLAGCAASPQVTWDRLYAEHGAITLAGAEVAVLGRTGLALHLATHAAQIGPQDRKALADLARGLARWPLDDWRAAAALAGDLGGDLAFAAGLRLLPEGTRLADELGLAPANALGWELRNRAARPRGTFHARALADVVRRSLFPGRAWLHAQYPWAGRGPVELIAARALHLARSPAWAARALWFAARARRAR